MKSSSGKFYITLDHVRALALFMVFTWHFIHGGILKIGRPVPFSYTPALFPFALLDEGHTGVAVFMVLSGYLFAKLLEGKRINFKIFLWNRALRLLPLLAIVLIIYGVRDILNGGSLFSYILQLVKGTILPCWPGGGWSITVEFHYYLFLPILLWMFRKSRLLPLLVIAAAVSLRWIIFLETTKVKAVAYSTIVGRIDQFILGMIAYKFRSFFSGKHIVSISILAAFSLFYWIFDYNGGFYNNPYDALWIFMPTIEGIAYAIGISWYDNSFSPANKGISRFIGQIGTYSYSLYLLHFFIVCRVAIFIHEHIMNISNFYLACFWSVICLVAIIPLGYLSFRFIESPFLKLRKNYIIET